MGTDTCLLGCTDGFVATAALIGHCAAVTGSTEAAYGAMVTCTPATCPAVPLDEGQLVGTGCTPGALVGAGCTLRCADGYAASGGASGVCEARPAAAVFSGMTLNCTEGAPPAFPLPFTAFL